MKPKTTWILIADGTQARVVNYVGPDIPLQTVEDMVFSQEALRAQDIVTDRPGRAFQSVGSARSGYEPQTDPVDKTETDFMKDVAGRLNAEHQRGTFDRLVIAAAPQALGDLRQALSDQARSAVLAELPKNLTNIPTDQLPRHFREVLAV